MYRETRQHVTLFHHDARVHIHRSATWYVLRHHTFNHSERTHRPKRPWVGDMNSDRSMEAMEFVRVASSYLMVCANISSGRLNE